MPFYLYQIAYAPEAVKAMVAKPQDRAAAAAKLIELLGGKLHHLFFAFGKYDVICLIEGPDDKMMAAGALAVARCGHGLARRDRQADDGRRSAGGDGDGRQGDRRLQGADGFVAGDRTMDGHASRRARPSSSPASLALSCP